MFTAHTKHVNKQRILLSNFGLVEETMDKYKSETFLCKDSKEI